MTLSLRDIRNSFGSPFTKFRPEGSSLIDLQKDSYAKFLYGSQQGANVAGASVENVFKTVFPVEDSYGGASIDFVKYRVGKPKFSVEKCKEKSLTYGADLFVTFALTTFSVDQETGVAEIKAIKEQEVMLCQIPLMTEYATFVINGFERVVVSQIHRSPGAFFTRDISDNKPVYSASIIPYRGSWITFSFDGKSSLYFRVDKKKKMPVYFLLRALGMDVGKILSFYYNELKVTFDHGRGMWSLGIKPESMVGAYSAFDIFDDSGAIVCKKGAMVNRKMVKDLSAKASYYCSTESLAGSVLFSPIEIDGSAIYEEAAVVSESMLNECINNGVFEIGVLDKTVNWYSDIIIDSIIAHKDMSYEQIMMYIFKILNPSEPFNLDIAEDRIKNTFFSPFYYDLFPVGRYKLNSSLGISDVDVSHTTLRPEDILLVVKKLILLKENNEDTDDIDDLRNRRLRSVGELLENQFRAGLVKMARAAREKLRSANLDQALPSNLIIGNLVGKTIKDFFMTSQLSQFMDQTNPLSELAHKRRISSLGAGGLSRDRAGIEVRDVHPTHYGRICPIETPEGQNIGLISSLATYSVVNEYGFIESPYRKVVDGVLQDEIVYLDAMEESASCICQFDKNIIEGGKISAELVSARRKGDFVMARRDDINYIDVSPKQTISVVTSLIPFLENDDAKRALMGSNMQRQAVPLLTAEAPLVGTGMESIVASDSGSVVSCKRDGTVAFVDSHKIIVHVRPDGDGAVSETDTYSLGKFQRSNNSTCINHVPRVNVGDIVKRGDVMADGPATKDGELSLGKNLFVAFMPWNGYNFEDSIVMSENIIKNDDFTSIHIEEFEVVVRDTRLGVEEVTRDIPNISAENIAYLDESGVIHLGTAVQPGDLLVGKLTPKTETPVTPEERLLRAIFGERVADVKDSSLRVPPGVKGTVVNVSILTKRGTEKDARSRQIEQETIRSLTEGHNSQVDAVQRFFANEISEMLMGHEASFATGKVKEALKITRDVAQRIKPLAMIFAKPKDSVLLTKTSSLKRQYEEIYEKLKDGYRSEVQKVVDGDDLPPGVLKIIRVYIAVKSKLQPGDKMAGRHGNKGVVSKIVPVEDMPFMEDGTPVDIVLNPLGVPSRMNIGQILETNLGWASHMLGKNINQLIKEKKSEAELKNLLLDFVTDEEVRSRIKNLDMQGLVQVGDICKKGFPFATPSFEAIKVEGIEHMLERLGVDKSGQITLYDGLTGEPFDKKITIGYMYMLKLHHLVDNKIHARSTGTYSLVTQQPLGGKSQFGGQRLGEMECWALQSYGAAYTLREMLTVKSDDVHGRNSMYEAIVKGKPNYEIGIPESFNVLFKELRSLCFNVNLETDKM